MYYEPETPWILSIYGHSAITKILNSHLPELLIKFKYDSMTKKWFN